MIAVILILVIGYFALWIYAYSLVVRFQNALHQRFPKKADQFLGTRKTFGINRKTGLFFLWEPEIKGLASRDKNIESLRRHAVICIVSLLAILFLMPLLALIFWLAEIIGG